MEATFRLSSGLTITGEVIRELYYDIDSNTFSDGNGWIVYDIYNYTTPSMLQVFKITKESRVIRTKDGGIIELIYPFDEEDYDDYTTDDYLINC